jgi:hypothetical protein
VTDEHAPEDIPSTEKGPRQPEHQEYTGIGTPRSADDGLPEPGAMGDRDAPVDPAISVGATTGSHPAHADEVDINRSGSGGSGGPTSDSMNELLTGEPDES